MYSKVMLFELKNTKFKTKHCYFIELSKILEVANFRFWQILDSLLYIDQFYML